MSKITKGPLQYQPATRFGGTLLGEGCVDALLIHQGEQQYHSEVLGSNRLKKDSEIGRELAEKTKALFNY